MALGAASARMSARAARSARMPNPWSLLSLACMFHLAQGIPVQPDFNYRKVEGLWHRVAMVISGSEQDVVAAQIRITPLKKGNLSVERSYIARLACRSISFSYRHTELPGKFTVYHANGEKSVIHVVETNYDTWMVLHVVSGPNVALYLFARGTEVSDAIKGTFAGHVKSLGFSTDAIQYPGEPVRCPLRA